MTVRDRTVIVPAGVRTIHGGRYGVPDWLGASGQWVDLPNSTLTASGVGWAGTAPGGTGNYTAIVSAWGGGVLNTTGVLYGGSFTHGTFLVIFGGGHGDYAGNELYAYGPLESSSPVWRRLTDPTIPAPTNVARDGSGNPVSRHTYDTLVYLPDQNKLLCMGVAGYYSVGFALNAADLFDFATGTWSSADSGFPAFTGGGMINGLSGYNSATGKAWCLGQGNVSKYGSFDPVAGTWSSVTKDNPNGPSNSKAGVAGSRDLFVFVAGTTVYAQSMSSPSAAIYAPTLSGIAPAAGEANALDWDETAGNFVTVDSAGDVFRLTPGANPVSDTWTWAKTVKTGSTPAAATTNGTFGRFRVNPGSLSLPRGLVLMRAANAPICYMKA